jgi:hypothetical protein
MTETTAETSITQDGRVVLEPAYCAYLREQGYTIDDVIEAHSVPSNSREKSHVVVQIQTYNYPRNHPELDVVEDQTEIWVCSCEDFQYNKSADVSESLVSPSQCGTCKHISSVSKVEKAKSDDKQRSLTDE